MTNEIKISVVVPAYNIAPYVANCLQDICAQTHANLEIIAVNDGSKDDTGAVLDECASKDSRIRVIHKENGGVTSARLAGIAAATGEYIGFVDGDDRIEPDMFEHLLANAIKYNADISHCGYQMVFPNGKIDYYYNTGRLVQHDKTAGLCALLSGEYIEPGLWNKLFHNRLFYDLLHNDVMDPSVRINEDLLMNYYLFKAVETSVYEDVCPYHYILRKGSAATSKVNEHKLKDPLRVLDILVEDTAEWADVQAVALQRRVYQYISVCAMAYNDQKDLILPYRREVQKRLRSELREILKGTYCSRKVKLMALWVAIWPSSYRWAHTIHGEISGSAHKFDLD